jgi:uncharacterized protein (DUF433 family)
LGRPLAAPPPVASSLVRRFSWSHEVRGLHHDFAEVRSGKRCITGARITLSDVLEYVAGGMTEVLADFPTLKPEHIPACLAFAAARERRLASGFAA